MTASQSRELADKEKILNHIRSIFQAFLDKDRETLRQTHTDDWTGFLIPSIDIERGLEAYMANAEKSLQTFDGTGYELIDSEIQITGDHAIVFYVARYDYAGDDGETHSIPIRSIDLYRRESGDWIQAGSHITVIPSEGIWDEDS